MRRSHSGFLRMGLNAAAAASLALAALGCASDKIALKTEEGALKSRSEGGISVELAYLDEETLKSRHKTVNNPFIAPDVVLGSLSKFLVFELSASYSGGEPGEEGEEAPEQLTLDIGRVELQFGGKTVSPANRYQLYGFWEPRLANADTQSSSYAGWDAATTSRVIDRTVLDNETVLAPGGDPVKGYLVFVGNLPTFGDAKIYVPFLSGGAKGIKARNLRIYKNLVFTFEY